MCALVAVVYIWPKALRHFLRVSETEDSDSINMAIVTVGKARDPELTRILIDFLMGEHDGMPKVPCDAYCRRVGVLDVPSVHAVGRHGNCNNRLFRCCVSLATVLLICILLHLLETIHVAAF